MTESTPRIIRKKTGNFLEDFRPGQVFRHHGGKTITDGLLAIFGDFSMGTNPLAKNARYARAYGYEGLVCPPALTMLVAFSQTVEDISENARANLEYIDMRFGAPVYVGDTIEVETKILGVRPSSSRPNLGIVHPDTDDYGKIHQQLRMLFGIEALRTLGCPILIYAARKPERLARIMTASAALHAGADYIRTHTPEMIWRLYQPPSGHD